MGAGQPSHRIALGASGWSLWRDAQLRTPGFAADGLHLLHAPACAAGADAFLAGGLDADGFDRVFGEAVAAGASALTRIAADPALREATTWQNPAMMVALDGLVRGGPDAARNGRRRSRESALVRYWQRYCGKNETIGFFGPVCWVTIDPAAEQAVTARPGEALVRERRVFLEQWAVAAYGDRLAEDPQVRPWFPPMLRPQLALEGRTLRRPARAPSELTELEASVLALCDGRRRAVDIAALVVGPHTGLPGAAEVYELLERLLKEELISWDALLPMSSEADLALALRVAGIGEEPVRRRAADGLDRLLAARDAVAAAAGDADALKVALAALDVEFTALTGREARRREGQAYGGRTLCYEDTVREVEVVFGRPFLDELRDPLTVMLQAARWVTVRVAHVYGEALREIYEDLDADGSGVRLADLWYLAIGLFLGSGERPMDEVTSELSRRWTALFDLDARPPEAREVRRTAGELAGRAAELFPAERPGWSAGRLHSPDLQICATDVDAFNRGDYTVVLGELHTAWATLDNAVFTIRHPEPEQLVEAFHLDLGDGRIGPLYPADFPRLGGRLAPPEGMSTDWRLGFAPAPGAHPDNLLRAAAVEVTEVGGELVATAPDGRGWPLLEVFSALLSTLACDAFKDMAAMPYQPRIVVDRLVVARETWRTTVDATGLAEPVGERERYLQTRRWRERLGLPEHVFVKVGTETKPAYTDLSSPHSVMALCTMLRAARERAGGEVSVVVSEMLPTPDQAWVPDGDGRRYFSELRMQCVDPATP